jgi:hypothetical protein
MLPLKTFAYLVSIVFIFCMYSGSPVNSTSEKSGSWVGGGGVTFLQHTEARCLEPI